MSADMQIGTGVCPCCRQAYCATVTRRQFTDKFEKPAKFVMTFWHGVEQEPCGTCGQFVCKVPDYAVRQFLERCLLQPEARKA